MVMAVKPPGRVGFAASSSDTNRIGTLGLVSTSGWFTSNASRKGGAMGMVAVPVPDAVMASVAI
jgi:hypothetical protein